MLNVEEEQRELPFNTQHSTFNIQHSSYVSSRSVDSRSKRHVVLRSLLSVSNLLHELIEMLGRVHEIDVVRIHNQQRRLVVPVKVVNTNDIDFVNTPEHFD